MWRNPWLVAGLLVSVLLQLAVLYVPLLNRTFYTVPLPLPTLLALLALASVGILATGLFATQSVPVRVLCRGILTFAAVSWAGVALLLFVPALSGPGLRRWVESLPLVGTTAGRLLGAVQAYRCQRRTLVVAFFISIVMALCYVIDPHHSQYCGGLPLEEQAQIIARSVGGRGPNRDYLWSTAEHLAELGIADADLDWLADRVRKITTMTKA